ncbi:kinase-like protein [Phlegmacium glaucopus]|nr:kinase-like protein [Phlegmacium glaucopus]
MSRCYFPEEASYLAKSFDCIQTIVRGESTVYQVICTRGRLRGRILALKKVSRLNKVLSSSIPAASLHQTLHHPNIVSLYSISSALSSDYHVLEFCSEGNLSDLLSSRNPSILSEAELRRVLKGVGSALVYLKEEQVIHRNVCPSTILFAEDMKPKLSGFEQAVRLPQEDNFISGTYEMATYPPPELSLSSRSSYDFAVDTWSLGCTAQLCVYGKCYAADRELLIPPSEGNHNSNLQDLLTCLLEIDHIRRMDASQILKHPFITDDSALSNTQPSSKITGVSGTPQSEKPVRITGICGASPDPPGATVHDQNMNNQSRPMSTLGMHLNHLDRRRLILGDVSNRNMRKPNLFNPSFPARRVVSDPVSFKSLYCITEEKPTNSDSTLKSDGPLTKEKSVMLTEVLPATYHTALPLQNSIAPDERPQLPLKRKNLKKIHNISPPLLVNHVPSLPIGTTRPQPINTLLLAQKTHKFASGTLTILPSHSLLVDFRENQRRRGLRGDEVLLIDPTGMSVNVFGAPHLSVPTCLIEPTNEYTIDTLPPSYWKLYNDVYSLIRQIKQKTPQLTINTNEAKCTLMANSPMGDIELLLNRDSLSYNGSTSVGLKDKDRIPSMRIRFSRQQCSLEFAQHVVETRGSEWKKRTKAFTGDFTLLLEDDLSDLERKAIHLLANFLQTCQQLEQLSALDITGKVLNSANDGSALQKRDDCISVRTLASLEVHKDSTNLAHPKHGSDREAYTAKDVLSRPSPSIPETRFIHSIGWCTKHLSNGSSSKAVYNMLFLDGTIVTIDGIQVEFTDQSGNVSRLNSI